MAKKRFLSALTALAVALSANVGLFSVTATAEEKDKPTVYASDVSAKAGETAYVSIGLENNPGIISMQLRIGYDADVVELVNYYDEGIFDNQYHNPNMKLNPYILSWGSETAPENVTFNGKLVSLEFKVLETAEDGDVSPISISIDSGSVIDFDLDDVEFEVSTGSITVGDAGNTNLDEFDYKINGSEITITGYKGHLKNVKIGSEYTISGTTYKVVAIDESAFEESEIESVVIPETVKSIGDYAFYDCTSLKNVTIYNKDCVIGDTALGYYPISRKEDGAVEGFTIKGYANSTAETYAELEEEFSFVEIEEQCQHNGKTYVKNQKESTCLEEGYTGDVYCSICDELIERGQTIAKGDHTPAGVWSTDETHHWKECTVIGCGNIINKEAHSGGEATCTKKAVCEVCGEEYGEVNAENHKNTEVKNAKEPTCANEGYTGDTYCKDCGALVENGTSIPATGKHKDADGKWESNEDEHFHTCDCGEIMDKESHKGGEATCTKKAVCEVCGEEYGEVNAENHKNTEVKNAKEPTCANEGYTGDTYCKDCGTLVENGTSIPAGHRIEKVDAKDPTHEEDGNIEYYMCKGCGICYADAEGLTVISAEDTVIAKGEHAYVDNCDDENHWKECECGSVIDKENHTFGEWTVTKEASETETGLRERECSVCGKKVEEVIPVIAPAEDEKPQTPNDTQTPDDTQKPDDTDKTPNTGNNTSLLVLTALLFVCGTSLAIFDSRKKNIKNHK